MNYAPFIAAAVAGYFLGALPFGFLVARWHGVDIFAVGSRNPGATNVKRTVGRAAGNLVFALDFLKGFAAAAWVWLPAVEPPATHVWLSLTGLGCAILGHCFPVFTRFRGGKGVATMLGGIVALMPLAALIGALVWVVLFYTTRYVSVASMGLAVSVPASAYFLYPGERLIFGSAAVLGGYVIFRHRENIVRLMRGTENRFPRRGSDKV